MMKRHVITGFLGAAFALCFAAESAFAADIAVVSGRPNDIFWNTIKKGVDDARLVVEANGGKVTLLQLENYDNLGPDAASLIRTAIGQGVEGIVLPNWVPEAEDEAIQAAVRAGIKVMLMNAGTLEKAQALGALNYIGIDEYTSGLAGAAYFSQQGAKNVLCFNSFPGAAFAEARCKGIKDGMAQAGGASQQLPLPSSNVGDMTAMSEVVKSTLLQDSSIDAVITLGSGEADAAAMAILQADKVDTVRLASFDYAETTLERIKDGTQLFAIDQQGYLQALLSVTLLAAHLDFGTDLPVRPVATGPHIVDASNIEATMIGVAKGAR